MKFFLKSKTIQGIILAGIGSLLRGFGVEVSNESLGVAQLEIINLFPELMEFIGLVLAGYGRVKASGGIAFKGGSK